MTMIAYTMVKSVATEARGIVDETIRFHAVFVDPTRQVKKGLFVPLENGAETLKLAIEHGAIGAFWRLGDPLPRYIPNQFPLFFVPSPLEAAAALFARYVEQSGAAGEAEFFFTLPDGASVDEDVRRRLADLQKRWLNVRPAKGCEDVCESQ
ncbi:hypothetical protein ACPVTF_06325 [Geobacillus icigianus]|uniref:Uncharacterized protein n=1 Tax=Geobacillus subterraneus TaxID=129338 RepID=A0A679FRB7_9BACL|nr:hypothetical protein B4113_2996 [Geobacillus sp. B4113_201601]BBW96797.1 hypothetical protein GsuE55_16300 [Geobacillus subterraneus]